MITRRPWFVPKRHFGWGWSPASWQGWVVTLIFLAGFAGCQPLLQTAVASGIKCNRVPDGFPWGYRADGHETRRPQFKVNSVPVEFCAVAWAFAMDASTAVRWLAGFRFTASSM